MAEKSKFFDEFKKFIARGNVIDMAVGVVVGSAFTAIVNQLVQGIINPCIGKLFGDINLADYKVVLTAATEETPEVAILYGSFIQAIINFLLVAFSVFIMVRAINRVKDAMARKQKEEEEAAAKAAEAAKEPEAPPEPSEEILLLREIRDSLKK
ncbi:MAG: large conductance mechanosensitive channel protein MscL [Clostridia bacterium]|nr:large conductance mechanosensitive channel protein MscL [Clostridia bacterium]MBQ9995806.1 large conductance mechanosensitive channel protein MscL [Clostridia bacterium]